MQNFLKCSSQDQALPDQVPRAEFHFFPKYDAEGLRNQLGNSAYSHTQSRHFNDGEVQTHFNLDLLTFKGRKDTCRVHII